MRKLLFATEYTSPDQNSTGYLWSRIISVCTSSGLAPEILSPSFRVDYESFGGNTSFFYKLIKQLSIALSLGYQILKKADSDSVLVTGTNPATLLIILPILALVRRFYWILLVHDVYPENLVAAGILSSDSPLYRILLCLFNIIYSTSHVQLCIGRDMQVLIEQKTGYKQRSLYLPNWVDENDVFPLPRDLRPLGIDGCVVFQFFGNIGRVQGLPALLASLSLVKSTNSAFIFIGGGAMVPDLQEFIANNPLIKIFYLGPLPLKDKNYGLSLCDVAFVSLDAGMLGLGVPSKAYFSLAAGKPLLASVHSKSEIGLLLDDYPAGWRCDPDSPEQLASTIDKLCANPQLITEMQPRHVFINNFSESVVLKDLLSLLKSCLYSPT